MSRLSSEGRLYSSQFPPSILVMPDDGPRSPKRFKSTFGTLEREKHFKSPPKDASVVPILNEFVTPHIESFNALFDDSGLPNGDGDGRGLLSLGLKDIGERVVFDGDREVGEEEQQGTRGNRLTSMSLYFSRLRLYLNCAFRSVV